MNKDEIAGLIEEARLDARDRLCPKLHRRTKPMTEAERIAAGLSESQKRALKSARRVPNTSKYHLLAYRDCGKLVQSIKDLGLLNGGFLNRKAMAVRKVLERSNDNSIL